MAYQIKSFETLVSDMVAWIVSHSPNITDLTPGSVIRSFCEAAGLCIEELYVSVYLGFRRYLEQVQENVFSFERKGGTKATANVVFGRTGTTGTITIPIGTKIKTVSNLNFFTTAVAQILNGFSTSSPVEAEAEENGSAYNVLGSTITVLGDDIDGVETVTNPLAAVGGVDAETDYQYKTRFQAYIEGLAGSNIAGLIAGALSVSGITSASIQELFPPVSNVNVKIFIDDGSSGGVSSSKIAEVQDVIDGDGTQENPGYRAAGVNAVVYAPGIVTQNIIMTVYVISGVDTDQVEADIGLVLTTYVNNLGVGSDIIKAELIAAVMSVYGVSDVNITTPSGNVTISDTQVGRLGTITVTIA